MKIVERSQLRMNCFVPPSAEPIPHGLPTSSGLRTVSALFFPLRNAVPTGWMGGRYSTSNPIEATYGKCSIRSRSVPCLPGVGP